MAAQLRGPAATTRPGSKCRAPHVAVQALPRSASASHNKAVEQALKHVEPKISPDTSSPASSKGFGAAKPAKLKPVSKTKGRKPSKAPVPGGSLDVVQVQDWGSGEQAELGELKVKNVERLIGRSQRAPAAPAPGPDTLSHQAQPPAPPAVPAAAANTPLTSTLPVAASQELTSNAATTQQSAGQSLHPTHQGSDVSGFYEQLCHEMALAEKRGFLALAGPAPPPLQDWSFTPARYTQYLTDCLAMHQALEAALQATRAGTSLASSASTRVNPPGLLTALQGFVGSGLDRAASVRHDLQVLSSLHPQQAPVKPSIMVQTHVTQLQRFGRDVQPWAVQVAAAGGEVSGAAGVQGKDRMQQRAEEEVGATGRKAATSLLAHAFAVYVLHAAGGMRFGAVAAEKLGLLHRQAARFYHGYPAHVKEPLDVLKGVLNAAGPHLTTSERNALIEALPSAVRNASILFSALAHRN